MTDIRPVLRDEVSPGGEELTRPGTAGEPTDLGMPTDPETTQPIVQPPMVSESTPVDVVRPDLDVIRLPRTGVAELDQALGDLESLLARLDEQAARLLIVTAFTFVSLFVPWRSVTTPGFQQAVPGIEIGGLALLLLVVAEMGVIAFSRNLAHRFPPFGGYVRPLVVILVCILLARGLFSPDLRPELAYSTTLWLLVPFLALLGQVLGLLGLLPAFRRRSVAPSREKE